MVLLDMVYTALSMRQTLLAARPGGKCQLRKRGIDHPYCPFWPQPFRLNVHPIPEHCLDQPVDVEHLCFRVTLHQREAAQHLDRFVEAEGMSDYCSQDCTEVGGPFYNNHFS